VSRGAIDDKQQQMTMEGVFVKVCLGCSEYSFARDARETRRVDGKRWLRARRVKWFSSFVGKNFLKKQKTPAGNEKYMVSRPAACNYSCRYGLGQIGALDSRGARPTRPGPRHAGAQNGKRSGPRPQCRHPIGRPRTTSSQPPHHKPQSQQGSAVEVFPSHL
jgi:hypothetical protein